VSKYSLINGRSSSFSISSIASVIKHKALGAAGIDSINNVLLLLLRHYIARCAVICGDSDG
jgi:hypothetical protein